MLVGMASMASAGQPLAHSSPNPRAFTPWTKLAQNTCMARCLAQYYRCDRGCQYIQNDAERYGKCVMGCVSARVACESRC